MSKCIETDLDEIDLPQNVIEAYKEAFGIFDKNGDGSISVLELGNVMRSLGANPDDQILRDMIKEVDFDGSGEIEFNEFVKMMGKANKEQDLRDAFKVFDKDGSGKISKAELKSVMESLGQHLSDRELDDMMDEADLNKDGEVDYEEFRKMMEG